MASGSGFRQRSVKGKAQNIASLQARLAGDTAMDVRLAAVIAIRQIPEKNGPESVKLLQASLGVKSLTASQIAALIRVEWQKMQATADLVRCL